MRPTEKTLRKRERRSRKGNAPDVNAARFSNTESIILDPIQNKLQSSYTHYQKDRSDHLRQHPLGNYGINEIQRLTQIEPFTPATHLSNRGFFRSVLEGLAHFLDPKGAMVAAAVDIFSRRDFTDSSPPGDNSPGDNPNVPALLNEPRHHNSSPNRPFWKSLLIDPDAELAKRMVQTVREPQEFPGAANSEPTSGSFFLNFGVGAAVPHRHPPHNNPDNPRSALTRIKEMIFSGSGSAVPNFSKVAAHAINNFKSKFDFAKLKIAEHGLDPDQILTFPMNFATDADYHENKEPTTFCTMTRAEAAVSFYMGATSRLFAKADLTEFKQDYWPSENEYNDYKKQFEKELSRSSFNDIMSELQKFGLELNTDVTVISVNANMDPNAPRNPKHFIEGIRSQIFAFTKNGETHYIAVSPLDKTTTFKIPAPFKEWVSKNPYRFFFNQEDITKATGIFTDFKENHKTAAMALNNLVYPMYGGVSQTLSDMMNQETPIEQYIHNMRGYYDITGIYSIYRALTTNDHKTLSIYIGDAAAAKLLSLAQPLKHVFVRLKGTALNTAGIGISAVANVYMVVDSMETSLKDVCSLQVSSIDISGPQDSHPHKQKKGHRRRPQYVVTARRRD